MKTKLTLSVLLLLPLAGCPALQKATEPTTPIDAANVAPLWNMVLDRHDALVDDAEMTPEAANVYKGDSELLRLILNKALGIE